MNDTSAVFLPVKLKVNELEIPVCCIDGRIMVDMRRVCQVLRLAWRTIEQGLLTAESFWQVSTIEDTATLLMPSAKLESWLQQPHGAPASRAGAMTRQALADIWAYEFPRQVLHLFPGSADARSHAAKLARAIRSGQAVTDPDVAAGIKKSFLTIRQNRKPIDQPIEVKIERARTIKRCQDVTPELAAQVLRHFLKTRTFRGLGDHFKLTTPALNRILLGTFKNPTPELLALHAKAFGANAAV